MKWRYLPVSVFIFIFALEILLRLVGWSLSLAHASPHLADTEIRIVTLGESTSTDNFEGALSWPQQLKTMLSEKAVQADIINLARPGTNSFYLVQKLETRIWELRPQVVIAMMGVNDAVSLKIEESFWYRNFYIARFYKWYRYLNSDYDKEDKNAGAKKSLNSSDTVFLLTEAESTKLEPLVTGYLKEVESLEVKDVLLSAKKLAESHPDHFSFIIYQAVNRLFSNMNLDQYRKFMILNQFLLEKGLYDEKVVYYRLYSDWTERHIKDCADFTQSMWVKYSYQFSERHLSMIANCASKANPEQKIQFESVLQNQTLGYSFSSAAAPAENMTAQSYRRLYDLSQAQHFKLVIMQYPLEDAGKLKGIFTTAEAANITFISNSENFSTALQNRKFDELFLDHFAKNFGHPSQAGHRLIAEQLTTVLVPLLKQE